MSNKYSCELSPKQVILLVELIKALSFVRLSSSSAMCRTVTPKGPTVKMSSTRQLPEVLWGFNFTHQVLIIDGDLTPVIHTDGKSEGHLHDVILKIFADIDADQFINANINDKLLMLGIYSFGCNPNANGNPRWYDDYPPALDEITAAYEKYLESFSPIQIKTETYPGVTATCTLDDGYTSSIQYRLTEKESSVVDAELQDTTTDVKDQPENGDLTDCPDNTNPERTSSIKCSGELSPSDGPEEELRVSPFNVLAELLPPN